MFNQCNAPLLNKIIKKKIKKKIIDPKPLNGSVIVN